MSYNRSIFAFEDVQEAFNKAMEAKLGIKITCKDRAAAIVLRSRFNYFRKLNRSENARTYDSEHPLHNRSVYDKLVLRIPTDEPVLYIEPRQAGDLKIEEIT